MAASLSACNVRAVNDVAGALIEFNDNGAWSWFEDERAVIDLATGKILVSSVAYVPAGSTTEDPSRTADVEIVSYDIDAGLISGPFTLSGETPIVTEADDHNSASLWIRPDGRYAAMFSGHHKDNFSRYRITANPGDASSWTPSLTASETKFNNGTGTTYSNLHYLSAENGDGGRLYNFTRTVGFDPNAIVSSDMGQSWTYGGRLLNWVPQAGDPKFVSSAGSGRPYIKYVSNGLDAIHFITTEDHPRNYDNSVYHGVIRNGVVYDSFGAVIDGEFFDGSAASPAAYTPVFDTDASALGHAWTTDLQLDAAGRPYALMTARANNDDASDHRFLYARFDGAQWSTHEIAKAGGSLYASEGDYTGLGALDPHDPDRLFISTDVDPRDGENLAHYEIFQGVTGDGGANWEWTPITANSTVDNLRPVVPKWDAQHTALLWMRGTYTSYTVFDTAIVGLTAITPITILSAADLNRDGSVNESDVSLYLSGLHADLSGLTFDQARRLGDVNGDHRNDYDDFRLFKEAFELQYGEGALARAFAAVPEPDALAQAATVVAALAAAHRRGMRLPNTPASAVK